MESKQCPPDLSGGFCYTGIMNLPTAWSSFNFEIALLIFIAYIVVDAMYAYYTLQVTKRKPYSAATVGALMHFILALGVLSYVQNYLYLIPLALGSWVGTFIIVKREQRLDTTEPKDLVE